MEIKEPKRITHTYEQTIHGSFEEIMPLYCPVRELDWIESWNPKAVYSYSGFAEADCVFITSHSHVDVVWVVSDYDVKKGHAKMYYQVSGMLVTKLEIQLTPIGSHLTKAVISYSKTSISKKGDKMVDEYTKEVYEAMMDSWEKAMNHYLKTGEMLKGLPNF